jgi:hypothetical protein
MLLPSGDSRSPWFSPTRTSTAAFRTSDTACAASRAARSRCGRSGNRTPSFGIGMLSSGSSRRGRAACRRPNARSRRPAGARFVQGVRREIRCRRLRRRRS